MYTRHDDVPVFEYRDDIIDAVHYNTVQTALRRFDGEIRLVIPRLRTLDLILQQNGWIIVDRALNDLPVAAWTNFKTEGRVALHQPLRCQLRLFHANAGIIIRQVLELMDLLLVELLNEGGMSHKVIDFPGKN